MGDIMFLICCLDITLLKHLGAAWQQREIKRQRRISRSPCVPDMAVP